ncbi:hypothetical protein Tco_0660665 [Tanacetum coccineum]
MSDSRGFHSTYTRIQSILGLLVNIGSLRESMDQSHYASEDPYALLVYPSEVRFSPLRSSHCCFVSPTPSRGLTARMFSRAQTPIHFLQYRGARTSARPTPPPSPLSPLSSPLPPILSPLPQILSPPLPVSSPPLPASPTYPLGYRAAMIRLRAESPSTSHPLPLPSPIVLPHTRESVAMMRVVAPSTYILAPRSGILPSETPPSRTPPLLPIPLPTPLTPLLLPSTDCREGVSEVTLPPQNRLCIALGPRYEVGESSSAPTARTTRGFRADYGFIGTLDDEIRRAHARTARLMKTEAKHFCEAWIQSIDASDTTRSEVRALWTIVLAQQTEIARLRAADRTRQS